MINHDHPKVVIYTQAYNTNIEYLEQCIKSVLEQTYKNIEYVLIDNGSTKCDCTCLMKKYAEEDERIRFIRIEKNNPINRWAPLLYENKAKKYFTNLDSDDWIEPDYIERLVSIAENTNSDVVVTGSLIHSAADLPIERKPPEILIRKENFSEYYPNYHVYFRTIWGKLFKSHLPFKDDILYFNPIDGNYGSDTFTAFSFLKNSTRIYLDNSALHHYRINPNSVSNNFNSTRSESDLILYNDALDFLSAYGPISERNMEFINIVYANAIFDTVNVLSNCSLPAAEKLKELRIIADREETKKAYLVDHPHTKKSKGTMLVAALKCGYEIPEESEDFRAVVDTLYPACGRTVKKETIELFSLDNSLLNTLATDNRDEYLKHLLSIISEKKYSKKFDFGKIVATLAYDKPLLDNLDDVKFIRKHQDIYLGMWNGKYLDTLHSMTDYLLSGEKASETFLTLYLNLSAALEKVDEFIFGKTKIAALYFSHKQYDKCREILGDLTDMGVEDTEEIAAIRQKLN